MRMPRLTKKRLLNILVAAEELQIVSQDGEVPADRRAQCADAAAALIQLVAAKRERTSHDLPA